MFYFVNLRSMTTNCNHDFGELLIERDARVDKTIAVFETLEEATEYILSHGAELTKKFNRSCRQPCVIYIKKFENFHPRIDALRNYLHDSDFPGTPKSFVFSQESYQMMMDENFIFCSLDHALADAAHVTFIKEDGTTQVGSTEEEICRCCRFF